MGGYTFEAIRRGCVTTLWDFGWADCCVYRVAELSAGYDWRELVGALMGDRVFRDSYMWQEHWKDETEGTHGPFVIERLEPGHFKPISFEVFEVEIGRVLDDPSATRGPDPAQRARLSEYVETLRRDEIDCFVLDVALEDERFRHELSFILFVFREFLLVDVEAKEIHQLVFGFD